MGPDARNPDCCMRATKSKKNSKDQESIQSSTTPVFFCFFFFVALRPMSTAMVSAGRSVHLTTLFPGQA